MGVFQRKASDGSEITFSASPWISGTRAAAYFGPTGVERVLPEAEREDLYDFLDETFDLLVDKVQAIGGNALVGLEFSLDPFVYNDDGSVDIGVKIVGTGAKLESVFK